MSVSYPSTAAPPLRAAGGPPPHLRQGGGSGWRNLRPIQATMFVSPGAFGRLILPGFAGEWDVVAGSP